MLNWKGVEMLGFYGENLKDALKAMIYGRKLPGLADIKPAIDGEEFIIGKKINSAFIRHK